MTRALLPVDATGVADLIAALRAALTADGPAVLAHPGGAAPTGVPETVPQRVAVVVETSGSSGAPKRVALSADALLASAAASDAALASGDAGGGAAPDGAQWLLALPAHYIAGLNVLVRSVVAGTDAVVLDSARGAGAFDAAAFVAAASAMHGDRRYASLVPAQLARLVVLAEQDSAARDALRRFDRLLVGGQSTPPALRERAERLGLRVTRTYGASETCGGCVYDGRPIGTVRAREVDGEVQLAGPVLAEGYLDDPDRTDASFVVDDGVRWYRTADAGAVDGEEVRVTGRRDRVIVSGGLKVSLDAVERLAPLSDAVAVPVDDDRWGQSFVLVTTKRDVDADAVGAALADALGRAARPRRILAVDAIPTLASGKPDRAALARLLL